MKKILAMLIMTILTIEVLIPSKAYAADVDSVLNDPDWIDYVERSIDIDKTPGLAVAAVNGQDAGFKNWGYADIEEKTPMTEDTPVHIGSCSKAFTALSVLLLQEQGKLSIEDSISDYIPWWHVTYNGQDADIKIWQLLNHCSGIPNAATMAKYPLGTDADEEEIARIAEDLELVSAPGERYEYCNLGYCILAYLTETVSGMPFDEYVVKEIMQPIGMIHSGYDLPVAQGYVYFFGRPIAFDDVNPKGTEGEGLVVTTPSDMVLWMKAQMGQLELPLDLANAITASHEMIQSHQPTDDPDNDYFNGWNTGSDGVLRHSGMNPNYTARVIIDTENDIAVFAVCNSTAETQYYAARSCYLMLLDNSVGAFPNLEHSDMFKYDILATVLSCVAVSIFLFAVVMLFTQKKRLAGKTYTPEREKRLFIIRLILLIPMMCLSIVLPYIFGAIAGYPGLGYYAVWALGGQSAIILCLILDMLTLSLIATSAARYIRRKNAR
ncbi:MAG: beta-lactamase family protein [Clostridiales bacterium]|nr:beta-lactamase family protein [Clostridiales bacterium]